MRAESAHHAVGTAWVQLAPIWGRLIGGPEVSVGSHRSPRFSSALKSSSSRLTPSSIIYNILNRENERMSHSSHNINYFNTINMSNNFTVADDRSNILTWLSPLDPKSRHQDIQDRRVENIGEWLLQTGEFRSWCAGCEGDESDNGVLLWKFGGRQNIY